MRSIRLRRLSEAAEATMEVSSARVRAAVPPLRCALSNAARGTGGSPADAARQARKGGHKRRRSGRIPAVPKFSSDDDESSPSSSRVRRRVVNVMTVEVFALLANVLLYVDEVIRQRGGCALDANSLQQPIYALCQAEAIARSWPRRLPACPCER